MAAKEDRLAARSGAAPAVRHDEGRYDRDAIAAAGDSPEERQRVRHAVAQADRNAGSGLEAMGAAERMSHPQDRRFERLIAPGLDVRAGRIVNHQERGFSGVAATARRQ